MNEDINAEVQRVIAEMIAGVERDLVAEPNVPQSAPRKTTSGKAAGKNAKRHSVISGDEASVHTSAIDPAHAEEAYRQQLSPTSFAVMTGARKKKRPPPESSHSLLWSKLEQVKSLELILKWRHGKKLGEELALRLMQEFGSLPAVMSASKYRLSKIEGVGPGTIDCLSSLQELAERLAMERLPLDKPLLAGWSELIDYLHIKTAYGDIEQFRVLFLDKKNRLIADELLQWGTINHVPVYPREIIRRSLELSATALVIVHNHPSGDPAPSSADVRMTRELADIAKPLGIVLHDHIVMGKMGHASLRGLKLL